MTRPLGALVSASMLCLTLGVSPARGAEPSRFLPWTQPDTPRLALPDIGGRPHTLADYRGQVVLINFWATWCEPCRDEMPSMQRLQAKLAGRPFVILAVNYGESEARVTEFVKRVRLDLRVLLDPDRDAPRAWRVRLLPSSFLVDADGRVRYSVLGDIDWTSEEALKTVRALLP